MATDFNKVFGGNNNLTTQTAAKNTTKQDKPKAQFWINLGYGVEYVDAQGEDQERFISLPMGLALDSMEKVAVNSSNQEYAAMQTARNDLHDQLMAKAQQLNPGEETTVNLTIQLRRVKDDAEPISNDVNPFVRKLDL